jgi:hypothetical protein
MLLLKIFELILTKSVSPSWLPQLTPSEMHQIPSGNINMDQLRLVYEHISPKPTLGECFLKCQSRVIFPLVESVRYAPHELRVSTANIFHRPSGKS